MSAPGPWKLVERVDAYAVADADGNDHDVGYVALSIEDDAGKTIVSDEYGIAREHMVLMAAAPELLAALDRAHLQIIQLLNEGDFKQKIVLDLGYIVDAVANAKGRSSNRCQICGKPLGPREGDQPFDANGVPRAWAHSACVEGREP